MAEEWSIRGDYVEACNCAVACQCVWLEPPDGDVCTVSLAWDIEEGEYGDVDLSGLGVAMLIYTDEGVMFDPETGWYVALLVDEEADSSQQEAITEIFTGSAGGVFAVIADAHVESAEVATAPFEFFRDGGDFAVEIGDLVTMETAPAEGFNDDPGTISPHPLGPGLEMKTAKSQTATVSYDDEFSWDVSQNNSYYCDFELANA